MKDPTQQTQIGGASGRSSSNDPAGALQKVPAGASLGARVDLLDRLSTQAVTCQLDKLWISAHNRCVVRLSGRWPFFDHPATAIGPRPAPWRQHWPQGSEANLAPPASGGACCAASLVLPWTPLSARLRPCSGASPRTGCPDGVPDLPPQHPHATRQPHHRDTDTSP